MNAVKYCLPMVTTFFQVLSIYIVGGGGSWNPSALSEWEFEELWEASWPWLSTALAAFFSEYSQPQPFTTASMVIYGNPCGMQDGNSIFIENYQSEDLGASIHQSKPSLHLLDSFRLKSHHKTSEKFEEAFFSLNTKRPTGADASVLAWAKKN